MAATSSQSQSKAQIYCTQCGKKNNKKSNFCFHCGNKLQKKEDKDADDAKENLMQTTGGAVVTNIVNRGYNTLGKVTRIQTFFSDGDYGFGAVKQANEWMENNADIRILDIEHFVHPVVKFYVWVKVTYTKP